MFRSKRGRLRGRETRVGIELIVVLFVLGYGGLAIALLATRWTHPVTVSATEPGAPADTGGTHWTLPFPRRGRRRFALLRRSRALGRVVGRRVRWFFWRR
jgi:hypothetical protein